MTAARQIYQHSFRYFPIAGMVILLTLAVLLVPSNRRYVHTLAAPTADLIIYDDSLAIGWQDWSWDTTRNLANPAPVYSGNDSISITYTKAWAGFYLHSDSPTSTAGYDILRFWIHGGSAGGQALRVVANGDGSNTFTVSAESNTWTRIDVALVDIGSPATISDLYWQDPTGSAQPTFYMDDIALVNSGLPTPTPAPPAVGPVLSVDALVEVHSISPYIYGMNFADENLATELFMPVNRWGGNGTTRYNWQQDASNHASDWYFENLPNDNPHPELLPDGSASDLFVEQNRRTNTQILLTVPLIGWTPNDRQVACGFSVSKYGAQQSTDSWHPDCGNGVNTSGMPLTGNDPHDTSLAIGPSFVQDWMRHLISKYGSSTSGGVRFYNLDNEPMLWNSTHRDVHPQPTSYDEINTRTQDYAAAIKAVDPGAQTLGPVLWGWTAYFYSAADISNGGNNWWDVRPDRKAHGDIPFVPWYLQQLQAYQQANGVRILDYLDLHYYPQAPGVALSPAGDSATQALRLRSTRSLWDPNYPDESWINGTEGGPAVRLIPRMRDWVTSNYPGTKLAITEYNWGALDNINGALAEADVLGIFGREGLNLATLWAPPNPDQPGAFAFRIYRNYDGSGHAFGDSSLHAASADQDRLSIYAARRSKDGALTLVVINKTLGALTSSISLSNFYPTANAQVYRYSAANLNAIQHAADQPVRSSGFSATFPSNSITLFVISPSEPPSHFIRLPLISG